MKKSKKIKEQKSVISRPNQVPQQQLPVRPGCTMPLNGCLGVICLMFLTGIIGNECRRSSIRLEEEKIKLEQMKKDGVDVNDKTPVIIPDTLKIGNYQKTYIPLIKMYQGQERGK